MLPILCVRLTMKVKVGIPESFKVGWYPLKKTGSSHLNSFWYRCLKKNYEMCSDWRWRDFVLNFAVCSADFHSRKRIHDLVSITRIAFKD